MADAQRPSEQLSGNYTVVARRYRPKSFGELVGQDNISHALGNAIVSGRVGHAYLFTGARGVGKTSTARIFAKALNAPEGSTPSPDNSSDICQAIDAGEDMDVIEIDGASNRGIEEIRQLRANINVRPSRSRYKIYIIDEVHMLTTQAFNALLKTLEEPPEHVKFIFCTTDAEKIPITVLSRCQRFDFAPVGMEAIQNRLQEICEREGYRAQTDALALLARRAAGSMRDSQSLLEQIFSFSTGEISVDQVHALLGTADEGRLLELVDALKSYSALGAMQQIESAMQQGADAGQLAEQLLSYLRDLMTVSVGGGPELLKLANPAGYVNLQSLTADWGLQTILASIQILDEALVRMRYSIQPRTLLELALVQICQLKHLANVGALIEAVGRGSAEPSKASPTAMVEKKNTEQVTQTAKTSVAATPLITSTSVPSVLEKRTTTNQLPLSSSEPLSKTAVPNTGSTEARSRATQQIPADSMAYGSADEPATRQRAEPKVARPTEAVRMDQVSVPQPVESSGSAAALEQWRKATTQIEGMLANFASLAQSVEPQGSDKWCIVFPPGSQKSVEYCEVPQRKQALLEAVGSLLERPVQISFRVQAGEAPKPTEPASTSSAARSKKLRQVAEHPLIERICQLLDGEILRVDSGQQPGPVTARPAIIRDEPAEANFDD